MIGYPVSQDLVARLLQCHLDAKARPFMQKLLGRQTCSKDQFNWLRDLAAKHRRKLAALKKPPVNV